MYTRCRCPECLEPRHLIQLAWGLAHTRHNHEPLLQLASQMAMHAPHKFKSKELSLLLWSLATVKQVDPLVFSRLGHEVLCRMSGRGERGQGRGRAQGRQQQQQEDKGREQEQDTEHHPQQQQQQGPHPQQQQSQRTQQCSHAQRSEAFSAQDVAHTAYAHALAGVYDAKLFDAAAELCLQNRSAWFASPKAVQGTLWALGFAGHYHAELYTAVAAQVVSAARGGWMAPSQLAAVVVVFAQMRHYDPAVCSAVADTIRGLLEKSPESVGHVTLANVLWSLAVLNHVDVPLLQASFGWLRSKWGQHARRQQQQQQRHGRGGWGEGQEVWAGEGLGAGDRGLGCPAPALYQGKRRECVMVGVRGLAWLVGQLVGSVVGG